MKKKNVSYLTQAAVIAALYVVLTLLANALGLANYAIQDVYKRQAKVPRFGSGEAKGVILESVRGTDLYLLVDVCNYSLTYSLCGHVNHMSPDDHYQDLKRIIAAVGGKARRITAVSYTHLDELHTLLSDIAARKQKLLSQAGFPEDYLEPVYDCPDCQDTRCV